MITEVGPSWQSLWVQQLVCERHLFWKSLCLFQQIMTWLFHNHLWPSHIPPGDTLRQRDMKEHKNTANGTNGIQSIFIFNKNHFLKPKTNKTAAGSWIGVLNVNKKRHSFFHFWACMCNSMNHSHNNTGRAVMIMPRKRWSTHWPTATGQSTNTLTDSYCENTCHALAYASVTARWLPVGWQATNSQPMHWPTLTVRIHVMHWLTHWLHNGYLLATMLLFCQCR